MNVARLKRTKKRLLRKLRKRDFADLDAGRPVGERRWLRTRLYRLDVLLERKGGL